MQKYLNTDSFIKAIADYDTDAIVQGITNESPIVQLNALIYGTKMKLKSQTFVGGVHSLTDSDSVFFGVPMWKYAKAALHVLEIKKYTGDDDFILRLIDSGFEVF